MAALSPLSPAPTITTRRVAEDALEVVLDDIVGQIDAYTTALWPENYIHTRPLADLEY